MHAAVAVVLFAYVLVLRTYDVASTFLMLGEQARDWTIALGSLTDLPLLGAPSTAGGRGLGPAYYWLLWLGRVVIGPFTDNLPHAGGITVALLQSVGDAWLFAALARRMAWPLALAAALLIASGPFDIAISSVIWNPPVADALIKMALASALMLAPHAPLWRVGQTLALAWMALQCHLSAAFVAAPLVAGLVLQPLVDGTNDRVRRVIQRAVVVVTVILVLQVPFVLALLREPSAPAGPTTAIANITSGQAFRPFFGLDVVTGVTGNLFLPMESLPFWIPTLVCGLVVIAAYRRDLVVVGGTIGAVLTMSLVFAMWTRSYDGYWFLPMVPSMVLVFAMSVAALPVRSAAIAIGVACVAWLSMAQPRRIEASKRYFEYPQYDIMVRGSRALVAQAPVVRDVRVAFEVHPTMDRRFVYTILGGRIDSTARYVATIDATGAVSLRE